MIRLIILSLIIGLAPQAAAAPEFLMNAEAQATGGVGIVTTTGASALSYNPAALGNNKNMDANIDVGYLNVNYSYTYPEFEPVVVKVSTPYIFTGVSLPLSEHFTIGGSLFPVPGGGPGLEIKDIPSRQLSQEPGLIDVVTENTSPLDYSLSTGISFTTRSWFSIGVSYIRSKAETKTIVSDSESGSEIFTLKTKAISETGLLGLKIKPFQSINIGATYQSLTKTAVEGAFLNEGGESFKQVAHKGRQYGMGIQVKYAKATAWTEILYRHHSENSGSTSPFTVNKPTATESFNATSLSTGLSLKISNKQMISGSLGWHPTTVGSGNMAEDPNSEDEVPGIQFGDMDGISRTLLGAGYRHLTGKWLTKTSISYQTGKRTVGPQSRAEGFYKLNVFSVACAVSKTF